MVDDPSLYEELGRAWRHFASWREKIFAGYVTVLAALGVAFSQNTSVPVQAAIFAGAIVFSIVFWILDFRNAQLLNACQAAAALLEDQKGAYSALYWQRGGPKTVLKPAYGLAIDLLVGSVVAAAFGGMLVYINRWPENEIGFLALGFAAGAATFFVWALQRSRTEQWRMEVNRLNAAVQEKKGDAVPPAPRGT